jgi:hypothetical protein
VDVQPDLEFSSFARRWCPAEPKALSHRGIASDTRNGIEAVPSPATTRAGHVQGESPDPESITIRRRGADVTDGDNGSAANGPAVRKLWTAGSLAVVVAAIGVVADAAEISGLDSGGLILAVGLILLIVVVGAATRLTTVADGAVSAQVGVAIALVSVLTVSSGLVGAGVYGVITAERPAPPPAPSSGHASPPATPTPGSRTPTAAPPGSPAASPSDTTTGNPSDPGLRRPTKDVVLTDGTQLDLDSTAPNFDAGNCGSECDIQFRGPLNGIEESNGWMAEREATYESCLEATETGFRIHPTTITKGMQVCALTSQRRRAGLVVKDFTKRDSDHITKIVLTITVWEP